MARKDADPAPKERGFDDIIGIALICVSVLMLLALYSYDAKDVSYNSTEVNNPRHNWIGVVGAYGGYFTFFLFGAAAYFLPVLLFGFGLTSFVPSMTYLRKMWAWAIVFMISALGTLDLYKDRLSSRASFQASGRAGGLLGWLLNSLIFNHLGVVGATIIFISLYLISLIYLTNFHLFEVARQWWADRALRAAAASEEERNLEKKQRELAKEAKRLQDQVEKAEKAEKAEKIEKPEKPEKRAKEIPAPEPEPEEILEPKPGLGADLQPVPEPQVRDLSVPTLKQHQAQARKNAEKRAKPASAQEPEPVETGTVISASEVRAAVTTDEILNREPVKLAKAAVEAPPAPIETAVAAPEALKTGDAGPVVHIAPISVSSPTAGAPAPADVTEPAPAAAPVDAEPLPVPAPKPKPAPRKPKPITVASTPLIGNYQLPPMDFLQMPDLTVKPTETKEELMANAQLMKNTLAQFDIDVSLGDITKGPTITRYELHPAPGVKLEKITALSNNIAAALKAERIHILAPVPGKSSVGIEVPNAVKTKVIMRDLLESDEWKNSKARIPLALGKDVYGHPIIADLSDMPHLLIAGSTGSGKSVCINSIIASLLYKFSPDQVRFVMIDPKVVELQQYNALPHLVVPVVTDPKKVILALRWVVNEMEKRYQIFARVGVRNIKSFNDRPKDKPVPKPEPELPLMARKEKIEAGADGFAVEVDEQIVVPREEDIIIPEKLSYIVVIIDELADLMLVAPADVEMAIARITQMARAAGIHCIVATQRPSVDVITGVIKANIPARIAFQVASRVDSRTILDAMGADKLLGKGDMLYLPPGSAKLNRAQGVLITDQEIQSVVDFIAAQGKPSYELEIHKQLQKPVTTLDSEGGGSDEDEGLIEQCIEVIRSEQKASVSLLQRRLRLGYTRAARIMDELENRGIVGPSKGAEPRDILIDLDGGGADGAGQYSA